MDFKVTVDYKHVVEAFGQAARGQTAFVAALTATKMAQRVATRVKEVLPQRFKGPIDFTLRGVTYKQATKAGAPALVYFKNSEEGANASTIGNRPMEYIRPGAEGSARRAQKRSEFLLTRAGFLPAGWVMVPGSFMKTKIDGNGNVPGQYYRQVIRSLQIKKTKIAKPISKASQKRAARMGVETEFFAVAPGANKLGKNAGYLPSGVYQRTGPGGRLLRQYFLFVKSAKYSKRLDLEAEAIKVVQSDAQAAFLEAIAQAKDSFLPGLKVT